MTELNFLDKDDDDDGGGDDDDHYYPPPIPNDHHHYPQSPSSYPRHLEGSSLHTVSNCVDLHTARVSRRHAGDDLDEGRFKKTHSLRTNLGLSLKKIPSEMEVAPS